MERDQQVRLVEAILFASAEPISEEVLAKRLPEGSAVRGLLESVQNRFRGGGVELVQVAGGWAFRTAADLAPYLRHHAEVSRKLSRAAVETLAIIAYHQPITRAEVEEIRGVALSKGTLDILIEAGWLRPMGRRRTPGRPVTWGTTERFLDHFGLKSLDDLPGVEELRQAGLLDSRPAFTAMAGAALGEDGEGDGEENAGEAEEAETSPHANDSDSRLDWTRGAEAPDSEPPSGPACAAERTGAGAGEAVSAAWDEEEGEAAAGAAAGAAAEAAAEAADTDSPADSPGESRRP